MPNDLVTRAAALAELAHSGQFRRDGTTPYIDHPRAVAARAAGDPTIEAVAWLHDVLEDTSVTEGTMRDRGIPDDVIACVRLLTHDDRVEYEEYLAGIKANPIAKRVKIADMLTNLGDRPTDKQILKYSKGLLFLLS